MKNFFYFLLCVIGILAFLGIFTDNEDPSIPPGANSVDAEYSTPWQTPDEGQWVDIGRVLVKHNVTGCGEYFVRQSRKSESEFLVACSSDGANWNYYQVWPKIDEVIHVADPDITTILSTLLT